MCTKCIPFAVISFFLGLFVFFTVEITVLIDTAAMWKQESPGWPATFPCHSTDSKAIFPECHHSLQLCPAPCLVRLLFSALLNQQVPDYYWLAVPGQPQATTASGFCCCCCCSTTSIIKSINHPSISYVCELALLVLKMKT